MTNQKPKIKIVKNGPCLICGKVPLTEKIITSYGKQYEYTEGQKLPQAETYALCRCGHSKTPPFCDGSHQQCCFDGTETASREAFVLRAKKYEGPKIDLLDDERCAFARFCHRNEGNVWELVQKSDKPGYKEAAIKAASDCPTGRLVAVDKSGVFIEPEYEPAIEILQDPETGTSGPIFVKGGIPIESADGHIYEIQNRAALCRCGESLNKPFCDAMHVRKEFKDKKE
ncbi:MAG: CDGSH iron-sulfur domain-containing protein [Clostridia bacterium]|jgi:CDGSH-type Zn-finger protein|nr:CDGSH iron-sulfur domain-containing protein [Clostridia bacterium]